MSTAEKLYKHDLSSWSDLALERRRFEKDDAQLAESTDTQEAMRRKDLLGDDEHVRRSAPPDSDMYSEHMRPSLSARSASFADSAARASPTAVHRAIEMSRKRQRSFSDDRSLTPSLSKRRISEDVETSHELDAAPENKDGVKADEHMDEDDEGHEADDDEPGSTNQNKLGMKHFTLLYHFTEKGFNCRLCS